MDCCDLKSCHVLNWSDIRLSGITLTSINLAFILHWIAEYNFYTICAYLLLFYICSGIIIGKLMKVNEYEAGDNYEHISRDKVESWIKGIYRMAIDFDLYMKRVISLEDNYLTAKFFITIFAVINVSSWFSECFLIWLCINFLFAWSPFYNMNKDLIDNTCENAKKSANEYFELVRSLIPKYEEKSHTN